MASPPRSYEASLTALAINSPNVDDTAQNWRPAGKPDPAAMERFPA
jgi:hypothetical protein